MKKAEAISILATSVRPREAKDRARYDEAVKMAIEALKCSETPKSSERTAETAQNVQNEDLIQRKAAIDAVVDEFKRSPTPAIRAKLRLEALPSVQFEQKKDGWIPISKETNPTKSGWYLVTVHEDAINENKRFTGMAEFNTTNGMWYDTDEPTDMYLRWMPLPEPYRGGDSE